MNSLMLLLSIGLFEVIFLLMAGATVVSLVWLFLSLKRSKNQAASAQLRKRQSS